ncbi:MAG: hypothetical protein ABIQ04_04735 [Candidatus Saccharimonadales bacterium]
MAIHRFRIVNFASVNILRKELSTVVEGTKSELIISAVEVLDELSRQRGDEAEVRTFMLNSFVIHVGEVIFFNAQDRITGDNVTVESLSASIITLSMAV